MKRNNILLTTGLILLLLMAAALTACSGSTSVELPGSENAQAAATEEPAALEASGFIEAEEVSVVSEVGGRVDEVLVDEADTVEAGQVVVQLDSTLLNAQRIQAEAAVAIAEANLEKLKAGASEEELATAQALIDEVNAQIAAAERSAGAAWGAASNPQSVDVQIASAELELEGAFRQIELMRVELEKAEIHLNWLKEEDQDQTAIEFQEYTVEILRANLRAAEARYQGVEKKLELLREQRDRPISSIAVARSAQSQVPILEAQLEIVQASYDLLANGALPEEIAIAQAQVDLAAAQVDFIDAQIAQLTLVAPIDGVVTTRAIHAGETASAGISLLSIANLNELKLVVYIPETQISRVKLGSSVSISVDAYPSRTFEGLVTYIAREAEFTPRNVQTEEERVNLVFAVEIRVDNEGGELKPGMPADVVFEE